MAEMKWTQEAATWLEDIYKYIAQDNLEAAGRVVRGIYDKVEAGQDRFRGTPSGTQSGQGQTQGAFPVNRRCRASLQKSRSTLMKRSQACHCQQALRVVNVAI